MQSYLLRFFSLTTLLALLLVVGCAKKTAVKDFDDETSASAENIKTGVKPIADDQVVVIETADYGNIVVELYPNIAPRMVAQFKKLIQDGFYNGTTFHRINAEAGLVQGGDPLSRDDNPLNDGLGDSNYPNVPGEFSDIPFERGTVGAARRGATPEFAGSQGLTEAQARNTANCQFFITLKRAPEFNEDYTVFGRVIEGIGNADIIAGAPVEEGSERPAERIIIRSVTLQPRSKFPATQNQTN
ncbi:MAG: peptidylprolyl isomerase [Pyrinomonadaceae bacterium]